MAVPIKSNNTQQGCNPISSNCVVWQGPDIPCINLCTGDSVSDVVAKMATELCEIADQLDISLLDLSCFNPLCPTPQNFRDVMQIIIDKICALENGTTTDGVNTSGCPSDCEIAVAPCLQYTDFLGNTVVSLPIKDYVILIGNRICTILTSIANLQTQIDSLDTRVTNLENGSGGGSGSSFNVTSQCVTNGSVTLAEYIPLLDAAFCELQGNFGSQQDYLNASSVAACVTTNSVQMTNPPQLVGALQGWLPSPQSAMQQIQNLWVAICDIRTGLTNLQDQLTECCAPEAACPTTLPRPTVYVNKTTPDDFLYFRVSGNTNPANTGIVLADGSQWALVRFEGTVTPSFNGSSQSITQNIPNPSLSSNIVDYTGSENLANRFLNVPGASISLVVSVVGTFFYRNLTTNQECSVSAANNANIPNQSIATCPLLPGQANQQFNVTPVTITCNNPQGSSITVSLGVFPPVTAPGVTNANTLVNITYNSTATGTQVTIPYSFSNGGSIALNNIACNSSVTFNAISTTQNGQTVQCANSSSIPIPPDTTPLG
jgi:hypothetical protein